MAEGNELESYDDDKNAFMNELESLRPDLMYAQGWTEAQKNKAVEMLRPSRVKAGMLSAIPLWCRGEECQFSPSCPLLKEGLAPANTGKCPIEQSMMLQLFNDYVDELEVDTTRMVEVSIVRDLVDQEIQQIRKTWLLSQEDFIQENVVGVDEMGNVQTRKELHQAVDYEERILKRKEKLRNALLATREAKYKAGQNKADAANQVASLLQDIRKIDKMQERELLKEAGMVDDDYIDAEVVEDEEDIDE